MTGRHHRGTPLIRLLARLGWQRDPDGWTVSCRDLDGRRARLLVRLAPTGITPTAPGPLRLTVLQVGQLRGAAREAIYTVGLLADPDHAEPARRSWRAEAPTAPCDDLPRQREVIRLIPAVARLTVWELCAMNQAQMKQAQMKQAQMKQAQMKQAQMNQAQGDLARRT